MGYSIRHTHTSRPHRGLIAGLTRDLRDLLSGWCGHKKTAVRKGQADIYLFTNQKMSLDNKKGGV